ncbi:hypothetical protein CHO01_30370 [Cellulomonas hominis]|jgi:predicted RNase H-like HicB family nuclease|uniref:Putative RNase H-like HicB family nuclease n=1 Tax=Cellulomonas hominis TaxID=156981 RepID=A0A511FFC1_9CELL|nr:type II toxin-antitoxin system HicB family antitoxin [Cellulomonas hominis]MBB5472235.1 putative RNase H-like HicB family nuclease [Cellulomonas hominis]NKY06437.1 type II toxin-antitoxin system HicB family antitoxin [Cellulomonas hominis]NKY12050.1 type II toxin-antitoxin system HicB family antitoxin [Cellulomonas hominis]GEL47921.1 hypothetical protein CHO01_30370 [Cellulomonas hominis]
MSTAEHYTYRVRWSGEDEDYLATVAEFGSLSWLAPTPAEALTGALALVAEVLEDMAESGEAPPAPLAERRYSGKFVVRIPPEAHRRLAIEAAEQHVSLNRLASQRLAGV